MKRCLRIIDNTSEWTGRSASWIILALIVVMVLSTILRYGFNKPPFWSYDMPWMLYSGYFLLGGAYCLLHEGHVRVDLISSRLPLRSRSILEMVNYLIIFAPLFYVLIAGGIPYVYNSWAAHETSPGSSWAPPVSPIKTLMVAAFALLALQGVSQFIKHLSVVVKRRGIL